VEQAPLGRDYPAPRYAWYVVALLLIANVSAHVDRQILSLLVDPIKQDLGISDTKMGLLIGSSFGLFYATLGLPLGRLADSWNRRNIIAIGIALWSLMTALFGIARGYVQLLLARTGVGVGEAALIPPAVSLLGDLFPPKRLATALSFFSAAVFIGSGLAYYISGVTVDAVAGMAAPNLPIVGTIRPWQAVFLVVGLPGIVIALLVALTVREPPRRGVAGATIRETVAHLTSFRAAFLYLTLGYAIYTLVNYGTAAFLPSYFRRVHGWTASEIGLYMGGGTTIFGTLGIIVGGWIADRWRERGVLGSRLLIGTVGALGALASGAALYTTRDDTTAKLLLIPLNIFHALPFGAAPAALVDLAPARMRGQITALFFFAINVIGFTLGPVAVGQFTDRVYGDNGVGYSILTLAAIFLPLAALLLAIGSRVYGAAVRRLQAA
jgi:MFS family permease